jgi:hypothetical protein
MNTLEIALGISLISGLLLLLLADSEKLRPCAECGEGAWWPVHFRCYRFEGCPTHHCYRSSDWPYGLIAIALVADVALWLVIR